jgi:hypothetical protein
MLISVAFYDFIVFNIEWFNKNLIDNLGKKRSSLPSFKGEGVEIGLGELIFYSFLPAHVQAYYGTNLFIQTLAMIGIGIIFNLWILQKRSIVAGLPAPIILGILPLLLYLVS